MLINLKKPSTYGVCSPDGKTVFNLKPGINEVTNEAWNKIKSHPVVKALIADDVIDEMSQAESASEASGQSSEKEALEIVKNTVDTSILESIIQSDKRKRVQAEAKKRIAELNDVKRRSDEK